MSPKQGSHHKNISLLLALILIPSIVNATNDLLEIKEGLNYKLLDNINDLIINNLGLIPTKENKYKRGLRLTTSKILSRKKHQ